MKTSVSQLRELFELTADGRLLNRQRRAPNARLGDEAGCLRANGYRQVMLDGRPVSTHRIVYAMATGEWPHGGIDHINGDRGDNRVENLRDVDQSTNMQNRRKASANNKSGFLGVCASGRGWKAQIKINGKIKRLGTFPTPEAAHEAYVAAKREWHPGGTL